MTGRLAGAGVLAAVVLAAWPAVARQTGATSGGKPARIVLLVDSSSAVATMLPQFRAGLNSFLDGLPEDAEVALISTGGQLRIRVPPTTDRERLHKAAGGFAQDGGANAFLDTLLESDQRFLKKALDRRSVFVVLTTDAGTTMGEPRIDDYNKFVNDFRQRRGLAYGIVVHGNGMGVTSDILSNLAQNTGGSYEALALPNAVAEKMKAIATLIAAQP